MFYLWMSCWNGISVVLAALIAVASLKKTSLARYRVALVCFMVWSLGQIAFNLFPILFNIGMANAFGPGRVSGLAYLGPILTVAFFTVPALGLLRVYSTSASLRWMFALTGLSVGWFLFQIVSVTMRYPSHPMGLSDAGRDAVFHFLLWLSVFKLRIATETPADEPKDAASSDTRRDIWV
jgi:hypothetical protein